MTATTANRDIFSDAYPEQQTEVRQRLDEIWAACAARDFDLLESFHGYGPKFTSFKDGALRAGADANAADERRFFSILEENRVDTADLAINVFTDVAVVTFNSRYSGVLGATRSRPTSRRQWCSSTTTGRGRSCTSTCLRSDRLRRLPDEVPAR